MAGRRAAVVSDNSLLARAIEANLHDLLEVEALEPFSNSSELPQPPRRSRAYDLIIVAASSPTSEPLLMLLRASLTGCIGQVPVLIISSRPFDSLPEAQIVHLDFPFHPVDLRAVVGTLLQAPAAGPELHPCP